MKPTYVAAITLAVLLTACASTKPANVVPLAAGAFRTTGFGESENEAQAAALKVAASTCSKASKRHVITAEQTKYKGVVSEATNRNLNKVGELASYAGAWIPGLGGDDDYEVTLTFSCEA